MRADLSLTMRAWPVARSIFDAPYVREANERTTSWINLSHSLVSLPTGSSKIQIVKPVRRACADCARGSKFGQDASLTGSHEGARSASEMQSCWLDKDTKQVQIYLYLHFYMYAKLHIWVATCRAAWLF